jgi:hypothetical protein
MDKDEDGRRIYLDLRQKYPKNTIEDLNNILNGLCAALTCLMCDAVQKNDHMQFLQLVYQIIHKNIW